MDVKKIYKSACWNERHTPTLTERPLKSAKFNLASLL
jgi:hypothetical protein